MRVLGQPHDWFRVLQRTSTRRTLTYFALLVALTLILATAVARADEPVPMKRVLVLHQELASRPFRARFNAAFVEAMRSQNAPSIDIHEEAIESERFRGADQLRLTQEYLRTKYADLKIDVIVVVGGRALSFARENREMFGSPAIVAIVSPSAHNSATDDIVAGLQGGQWVGGTIDLALALRPDTQSVFVVDGARDNNGEVEAEVERQLLKRADHLRLVYLRDLPLDELVSRLVEIPEHSMVLFVRQTMRDRSRDLDQYQGLSEVLRASPVPVFSQMEEYIGRGILGGYMWRFEEDARRLADMTKAIVNGTRPSDMATGHATHTTIVDWQQLQRWNIPERRLPAGTSVLFRRQSFFEQYRRYVIGGVLVFSAQLALIVGLLLQRGRRQHAERESENTQELYRSVVDTQMELICRFRPDTTLTFVNDAYCRFWRKTREELLGTKFVELIPAQARDSVLDRIAHLRSGMDSWEHPVLLRDGSVGWHHWIDYAIQDDSGRLVELQGVGRDITERKRAEEALGQAEARNRAMLRAIPDLMFVQRRDGTFVDYHARDPALLFTPPSTFLGKNVRDIMPGNLANLFLGALERAGHGDDPIVVEYELPMAETRHFEARLVSAGDDRVLSIVRDVTDAKRAMELNRDLAGRLIASQEAERQRIARELHDDVSQKIALLNIAIDQVAAQLSADEPRSQLQKISQQTGEIASDLHNLSHELHPSKLQMLGLVTAVQCLCRDVSQQRAVQVAFTHGAMPQVIDSKVSLCLYRIVQEALHNVARHSRAREAQVRLSMDAGRVDLQVADSGVGFDPQAPGHAGLGLISMRERVAFLGGELKIHAAPGNGTRIDVTVPLTPQTKESTRAVSRTA